MEFFSAQKILRKAQVFLIFFDVRNSDETIQLTSISMCKKFSTRMRFLQHLLDQKMLENINFLEYFGERKF